MRRRTFLAGGAAGGLLLGAGCRASDDGVGPLPPGRIMGDSAELGHRLRTGEVPIPTQVRNLGLVIVGAGVAGLSAAWRLAAAGRRNVTLLELADTLGGTARSGEGPAGPYPWGAHYLPVPNPETRVTLRFLEAIGLLRLPPAGEVGSAGGAESLSPEEAARHGRAPQGAWVDERDLVFDPEDRLFHRGRWDEGLYLRAAASADDLQEMARFDNEMAQLRDARGADGRLAFALPTELSSADPRYASLDLITMAAWLKERGYLSERLRWAVDYSCRDDYGAGVDVVSAWAAIHYYAGRRSVRLPETEGSRYFTWPDGNGHLVQKLYGLAGRPRVLHGAVVLAVDPGPQLTVAHAGGLVERLDCDAVILATPNHVTARLLRRPGFASHAPWLVANLALTRAPARTTGAWNNVAVESTSVGYVDATHQRLDSTHPPHWTWYEPLPEDQRAWLLGADYETLARRVLADLRRMHPDIEECVQRLDLWRWGHGTIIPKPGVQFGARQRFAHELLPRVAVAHTDLGGLPFFEEAQYHGVKAAERVLEWQGIFGPSWT